MGLAFLAQAAASAVGSLLLLTGPLDGGLPAGWEIQAFPKIERRTAYAARQEAGRLIVRAEADRSASGLRLRRSVDPKAYPRLRWSWKVESLPKGEDPRKKEGDDYAARIYVVFEKPWDELSVLERTKARIVKRLYGERPPTAAVNYIWSGVLERGEALENAYTDRVRMIAVRGREDAPGRWLDEERDLAADYRALFGEEPPPVAGISLMTDTDNTNSAAAAEYADLAFLPPAPVP